MEFKKYAIAIIIAICMILSVPNASFAYDIEAPQYITTEGDTTIIPVFGYVGPFEEIIIPEAPEIYVEIPVKILFAAFDTDNGAVTSPRYTIKNLSAKDDIKVEIEDFTQRINPDIMLTSRLQLNLVNYDNESIVNGIFPSDYTSAKLMKSNLPKFVEGSEDNILEFMIGGTWTGEFDTELHPVFDMTLKFSRAE